MVGSVTPVLLCLFRVCSVFVCCVSCGLGLGVGVVFVGVVVVFEWVWLVGLSCLEGFL